MILFDNNELKKYNKETYEKWSNADAYNEYAEKTKNYSDQKWNNLLGGMNHIIADFTACMKSCKQHDSQEVQDLVKLLQNYITENYYHCTKEILACLGKMYVEDERFKNNIDKNEDGTAAFISEAISQYCKK